MSAQPIAAIFYPPESDPTPVLAQFVRALQARGVSLAGAIQHDTGPRATCTMELELLPSGRRMPMSQYLGSGSTSCRLDPAAMAEAAITVQAAIADGAELAVFNKFGSQEALGDGLRDEMAATVMAGVPLITAVGERFLDAWTEFTGGDYDRLNCSADAALAWWDAFNTPD
ncbi:MAG TPA: DUF2478 domain-containing protein [Denitromonas sp.]|uniref:DUF2478 domain-containing protein n=1 Tax=Denitromonas sp. TaxID=2734609 RepID=UPI001DC78863|nr:DUF2478 domain-containing protein [Rhodocyclaceae bacterium]MCP5221249.1 DUF2478 domain-containing protein [Zoogloeaceae bacterium]HPR06660.1 DUF2478 domain-containing protein [Denitromonas sp.]HQU89352.1 DUF2478 domain-containing protein [Denitromonas sp.]HQV14565.1 DUF2478 domain-containing protein [Denitromonas sp.]